MTDTKSKQTGPAFDAQRERKNDAQSKFQSELGSDMARQLSDGGHDVACGGMGW